jgi:DNA ligase-1
MRLAELVATADALAANASRRAKVDLLAALLVRLDADELPIAVSWLAGRLRQGRIGLGGAALASALAGEDSPPNQEAPSPLSLFEPPPAGGEADTPPAATDRGPLSLRDVDEAFSRLARSRGKGVAATRTRLLRALFARADAAERDFLLRLLHGELRQGALGAIMEEAVARASGLPLPDVRRAAMLAGDLSPVAEAVRLEGAAGLERFHLVLFQPVQPMLAQPASDLDDALARLGEAALELKLDGARIQVHRDGDVVRAWSRTLREVTPALPEVVAAVGALPLRQAILDGEVIALRPDGRPRPFQETMRRFGRRLDVERLRAELPLATVLFDLLHLDGEDCLDRPQEERFALLSARAPDLVVPSLRTADRAAAARFLDEALARGHEGLVAKDPRAPYTAGGRGAAWLKVKSAHTLDLVVLAAEWGSGRRQGWLSNLHLGAYDPAQGTWVMLGKTFKGLTDELLAWQTRTFPGHEASRSGHVVHLRPHFVVEVDFDDVQASPRYPAGMALRLARVKRYRPDKSPEQADTVDTVRGILDGRKPKERRGGKGGPAGGT